MDINCGSFSRVITERNCCSTKLVKRDYGSPERLFVSYQDATMFGNVSRFVNHRYVWPM